MTPQVRGEGRIIHGVGRGSRTRSILRKEENGVVGIDRAEYLRHPPYGPSKNPVAREKIH